MQNKMFSLRPAVGLQ